MRSVASVSVNNYLSSCKSCVSHRASNHEFSCSIDMISCLVINPVLAYWLYHFLLYVPSELLNINLLIMLRSYHNSINPFWSSVKIFHSDLALAVRPKVIENLLFPHFCKLHRKLVGQQYRKRHVFRSLICGVSKHHSLVSCSLLCSLFAFG